jgi:formylglycine-generating enzyme required for sulfatase activity
MNRSIILTLVILITACSTENDDTQGSLQPTSTTGTAISAEYTKPRFALIIGNGNYQNVPSLLHPVNDANDMATALNKLGFEVTLKLNANYKTIKTAARDFGQRLQNGSIGLFYFSGYGLQFDNRNYLLPLQADIKTDMDIEFESLDARFVLRQMQENNSEGANLIILEASRENPYNNINNLKPGLTEMNNQGFLIAYPTAPNSVSSENSETLNSLYTKHLLTALREKAFMGVFELFAEMTTQVKTETNGAQVPWHSDLLTQRFCFGKCGEPLAAISQPLPENDSTADLSAGEEGVSLLDTSPIAIPTAPQDDLERFALVIGNGDYQNAPLAHSVNDAKDMAKVLEDLGFEVSLLLNTNKRTLKKAVRDFGQSLANSDIGLFYYSGHNLPFNNRNYLVPLQADIKTESDIEFEGLEADYILEQMEKNHRDGGNLIILDACQDNLKNGVAEINNPPGFLIAYANAPGWACDGKSNARNSIYTKHLLTALREKAFLNATDLLPEVTRRVELETNGAQVPWHSDTLAQPVCFGVCSEPRPKKPDVSALLRDCKRHFEANRLTSGKGGTALSCYQAVLEKDPVNAKALAGLRKIEARYVTWATSALDKGKIDKAKRYLASLRQVNPNSQKLAEFEARLNPSSQPSSITLPQVQAPSNRFASTKIFRDNLPDGSLGPEMVRIPAGRFRMGDIQNSGNGDEQPVHWVSVKGFAMGRYEITFAEYDHFAKATGRYKKPKDEDTGRDKPKDEDTSQDNPKDEDSSQAKSKDEDSSQAKPKDQDTGRYPNDEGWGRTNRPVINVSWEDATAYAQWLSQQTGRHYRLPTEAEWEYTARAGTTTEYWWGNEIGSKRANCAGSGTQWSDEKTAPVGSFAPNPFGVYDTTGNVWEWLCSAYESQYRGAEQRCAAQNDTRIRVLRGGSWLFHPKLCRTALRNASRLDKTYNNVGFRVVIADK